jgi:hypothetical protein
MGMRIGSAASSATSQATSVTNWQQRQQSFSEMMSSLQSGDLAAAQQSFNNLGGNGNIQGNSPLAKLGQALQNGDLAGAQQAAQTLQRSRVTDAAAPPSQPSSGTSGSGSLVNVTA